MHFRTYVDGDRYGPDYVAVREFLLELDDITFPFARWDWMVSHTYLQPEYLPRIGLWDDGGRVVALATYDTMLDGNAFVPYQPGYALLLPELLTYALDALASPEGAGQVLVPDDDAAAVAAARDLALVPLSYGDPDAALDIPSADLSYTLPDGFQVTSLCETPDYHRYGQVLWKGFDHEANGEGPYSPTPENLAALRAEFERPNLNPDLKIAVVAPNGDFASYCGMWQDDRTANAIVEPVATDPAYRGLGLGRAAVLEAVRRCGELGATRACVGSDQAFYYRIGFRPARTSTFWERPRG